MSVAIPISLPPIEVLPPIPQGLDIVHLSPTIGTEIHGIDLTEPLNDELQQFLQDLLLARKVIFFRDQDLTAAQHVAFARRWGELEITPFNVEYHPDFKEIFVLRNDGTTQKTNLWHSDGCWRSEPELGSILRARLVPTVGGDTLFADMYAAYEDLPEWLKRAVDGMQAVFSARGLLGLDESIERLTQAEIKHPPQRHPVIRTHPITGRKIIYVNPSYTSHIYGIGFQDSQFLLDRLYKQSERPEFQCRFKWRPNSIAFWDNRACQHYASTDYFGMTERVMERVTIKGDRPR
jgi:taurine dioxygenase